MAPINMGETTKNIFMYKACANLLQHLRWMGHLQHMDDVRNTKKMYEANLNQK